LFTVCGYNSVDEALDRLRIGATSAREGFEKWLDLKDRPSTTHPEVLATRHMTEEEEMDYIYENYIKEPEDEGLEIDTNSNSPNNSKVS